MIIFENLHFTYFDNIIIIYAIFLHIKFNAALNFMPLIILNFFFQFILLK
jgi:hypothetical protein